MPDWFDAAFNYGFGGMFFLFVMYCIIRVGKWLAPKIENYFESNREFTLSLQESHREFAESHRVFSENLKQQTVIQATQTEQLGELGQNVQSQNDKIDQILRIVTTDTNASVETQQ